MNKLVILSIIGIILVLIGQYFAPLLNYDETVSNIIFWIGIVILVVVLILTRKK